MCEGKKRPVFGKEMAYAVEGAKPVQFTQTEESLICKVPERDASVAALPYTLKLDGSMALSVSS